MDVVVECTTRGCRVRAVPVQVPLPELVPHRVVARPVLLCAECRAGMREVPPAEVSWPST